MTSLPERSKATPEEMLLQEVTLCVVNALEVYAATFSGDALGAALDARREFERTATPAAVLGLLDSLSSLREQLRERQDAIDEYFAAKAAFATSAARGERATREDREHAAYLALKALKSAAPLVESERAAEVAVEGGPNFDIPDEAHAIIEYLRANPIELDDDDGSEP